MLEKTNPSPASTESTGIAGRDSEIVLTGRRGRVIIRVSEDCTIRVER